MKKLQGTGLWGWVEKQAPEAPLRIPLRFEKTKRRPTLGKKRKKGYYKKFPGKKKEPFGAEEEAALRAE